MHACKRFVWRLLVLSVSVSALTASASAQTGDEAAGKIKVTQQCAECHRPSDWNGETKAQLESLLRDIAAGKLVHRKRPLTLSPQDVVDIAAYWTSGRKK